MVTVQDIKPTFLIWIKKTEYVIHAAMSYPMFDLLAVRLLSGYLIKKHLAVKYVTRQDFFPRILDVITAEHVAR